MSTNQNNKENMGLPNLSYTPPVEDGDEMDEDVGNEVEGDIGYEMEGDEIVEDAGVQQVTKKNKTLNDQQKFATYVALHTVWANGYKLRHVDKERLDRLGKLPRRLSCPQEVYAIALYNLELMERAYDA
ncbi:hypothetical protein D1007_41417 [Hordeum vulgare]|nr:hypothetical protein D1007_41417 [Hordeum vulgare]